MEERKNTMDQEFILYAIDNGDESQPRYVTTTTSEQGAMAVRMMLDIYCDVPTTFHVVTRAEWDEMTGE